MTIKGKKQNCQNGQRKERRRVAPTKSFIFCIIAVFLFLFSLASPVWANDSHPGGGSHEGGTCGKTTTQGNSLEVADPISAANGAYSFSLPLLRLGGPMDIEFTFHYSGNIHNCAQGSFPERESKPFWWSPRVRGTFVGINDVRLENGDVVSFESDGEGGWVLNEGYYPDNGQPIRYAMKETANYVYMMDPVREKVYIFNDAWDSSTVLYALDRNNNTLTYAYNGPGGRVSKIEDGLGRELNFTYTTVGIDTVIHKVTDQAGREIVFGYDASAADNGNEETLRNITDAVGNTCTFHYHAVGDFLDNIAMVEYAEGNYHYENHFIEHWVNLSGEWYYGIRVDNQTDAYGNTTLLSYNGTAYRTTVANPDGSGEIYEHNSSHSPPKSLTDATSNAMDFTKNEHNQLTSVTDRFGDTTNFSYHQQTGKAASITNNKRDTMNFSYAEQNQTFVNPQNGEQFNFTFYNLARVDYPDGSHEEFTYDARGNMLSYIDRGGKTWQYEYNARGQVTIITNPAGGVTDFTYNADATLASSTDSDTGVTTYGYDTYKRLNRLTHPDGTFIRMDYDLNGLITGITDERGKTYNFTYDANGNLVSATNPTGNETQYAHDLMDRITQSTNRRDKSTQYVYDCMSRVASITDPNGNANQLAYDARGWLNRITDPAGNVWQLGYGDEGLVSSLTTPLGYTTTYTRDKLGYITGITNPLGHSINFTRDEMTRIVEAEDALGRKANYTFDARGFLTSVTRPDIGTATYTRNDLALLTNIRDQNGKDWALAYTSIGRLQNLTDPRGNEWQYGYNERGFLDTTTYPTGETQDRSYDDAGNLVRRQYSDGTDLQFTYDDLNRLLTANDIEFRYNEVGRVVATKNPPNSFGATYDDAGRRKTATYADGLFTVTYQYDARDLLTSVTDDLTGTSIEFTYDDDGRLTSITRSNGANTTFTWDEATRLTRIQHDTTADLQYEYNPAGEITRQDCTLPLDPADYLTAETNTFTFDDASQTSSAGYSYDARGRQNATPTSIFTWDGAGRLTGTGSATLQYNGLGDLVNRTAAGNTTHYYYNYALTLAPIVAEKDEGTDNWTRFYVLAPTGQLLYLIDAADSNKVYFYHFDRKGNTLFLTGAPGTVTDSYAYTPYGKLLHHEGTNEQPFTFGGAYQARSEGDSDLYQMRARYYDANTGRFVSREPLWPMIGSGKAINPYQYAAENPMMFVDRTGLLPKNDLGGLVDIAGEEYFWDSSSSEWARPDDVADAIERLEAEEQALQEYEKGIRVDYTTSGNEVECIGAEIWNLEHWLEKHHPEALRQFKARKLKNVRAAIFALQNNIPQANGVMVTGDLQGLEQQAQELEQGIKRLEKEIQRRPEKKAQGVNEFANLPGLGFGPGVQQTPYGNQLQADRLTGKRGAAEKLDNKWARLFEREDKKDIKLSFDWEGSEGGLNVQPFDLAR